ncbi:MAG: LysR family transcriptional regulator [Blautia sp.]|nr:LysR family transcriptional regulator [Blautia sp.]
MMYPKAVCEDLEMQVEWLKAFLMVEEKRNFSEAADSLFISQSSLSKHIKALENSLGVVLFDRSHRRVELTPAGEIVSEKAKEMIASFDDMMGLLRHIRSLDRQKLRISVDSSDNAFAYIRRILDFFDVHPEYELELLEYEMSVALKKFEAGELDMILGHTGLPSPDPRIGELTLKEEVYYLGTPEMMHTLGDGISFADVTSDRLILHQNTYQEILALFRKWQISPEEVRPIVTTTGMDVLKAYLQGGFARSLMTESAAELLDPDRKLTRITMKEHPALTLGLLYHKKTMPEAARALLADLRANMQQ